MRIKNRFNFGFTLVELLSVIVVLGIILTIAIPALLDIIENMRKEAFKATAYSISDAGKYLYMHKNVSDSFYYYDGIEYNANNRRLEYDGQRPKTGIVIVDKNGKTALALHNGVYCATKPSNSDEVSISETLVDDCSTYRIINTCDTWEQIAIKYDINLNDLLSLNNITDTSTSTCGLDIKIPLTSDSNYAIDDGNGNLTYYKTYYTIGYISYSDPFSSTNYEYTIDLGNLPIPIGDIKTVKSTSSSVIEDLTDFEKYIVKKNIGEVIWPGEIPQQLDISQANEFKDHSTTSTNMTPDPVTVTCNATKCSATVGATIDNLTNVTPNTVESNTIVYTPIKFTVEFNGEADTQVADVCTITSVTDTTPGVLSGTGTSADPYLIESIEDLVVLSNNVNGGTTYSGKYLSLTTSLDFKDTKSYVNSNTTTYGDINGNGTVESLITELTTGNGFLPIGSNTKVFSGILNGNIRCLNNLYINRPSTSYVGLVGYNNGTITLLTLNNINVRGYDYTGGIAGYLYDGNVTESEINGSVNGNNYVGLAAGYFYTNTTPLLSSIIVQGDVSGTNYVGGVVGYTYDNSSSNLGYVRAINKGGTIASTGANVGRISGFSAEHYTSVKVSYNSLALSTVTVNGSTIANGNQTDIQGGTFDNLADLNDITLAEVALDTYIGGDNDNNSYYWDYDTNGNIVRKNTTDNPLTFNLTGSGTTASPYLINTYDELKQASLKPNSVFKLNADIDLSGKKYYMLGSYQNKFTGTFDGNAKTISNLTIDSPHTSYVGLVGYNSGTITLLTLNNVNVRGYNYTGGLAGYLYNNNIIENQVTGSVIGNNYVGLATGYFFTTNTPLLSSIIVQGDVTGANYVGGVVGYTYDDSSSNQGYLRAINKGGTITSTGANVGRISGFSAEHYTSVKVSYNSLALSTVTVNGSTIANGNQTDIQGGTFDNLTDLNDITLAEVALDTYIGGDNDNNGYYWDYDTSGNVVRRKVTDYPLTFNLTGSGTTASPYLINNYDELKQASLKPTLVFKLNADIDLIGKKFYMLGSYQNKFTGAFDGNTKTISNLTIDSPHTSYVGLIGYNSGSITTLTLNNTNVRGYDYTGGLTGYLYNNNIIESQVTGSVIGNNYVGLATGYFYTANTPLLSSIMIQGDVTGANYVGGVVGYTYNYSTSNQGYVRAINKGGNIISTGTNVGRISGYSAERLGIFVSYNSLALSTVTVNGSIITNGNQTDIQGGSFDNLADLNDINLAEVALDTYIGGDNDNNGYYWDYDTSGNMVRRKVTDYPLTFNLTGSGTTASPYLINNYDELRQASLKLTSVFKLNADIDLSSKKFYMLGSYQNKFSGTFDGNSKTINNLSIDSPHTSYVGFIGYNSGIILGLNLKNINIKGYNYTGGLVGYLYNNNVTNNLVIGTIIGNNYVGLATGYFYTANTPLLSSIIVQGDVSGANYIGGVVGYTYNYSTSYQGCVKAIHKGGTITSTGANVGRISGYSAERINLYVLYNSLALSTVTVNGSTIINNNAANIQGKDITSSDLLIDTTYTGVGFNFTDETLDYIWYLDNGVATFRLGAL